MENAFDYKQKWTAELRRRRQIGSTEPDPVPHLDDIIIDMHTGHVKTEGPLDEREKRGWDERLARREEAQVEVNYYAEKYARAKSPGRKHAWTLIPPSRHWHSAVGFIATETAATPAMLRIQFSTSDNP